MGDRSSQAGPGRCETRTRIHSVARRLQQDGHRFEKTRRLRKNPKGSRCQPVLSLPHHMSKNDWIFAAKNLSSFMLIINWADKSAHASPTCPRTVFFFQNLPQESHLSDVRVPTFTAELLPCAALHHVQQSSCM